MEDGNTAAVQGSFAGRAYEAGASRTSMHDVRHVSLDVDAAKRNAESKSGYAKGRVGRGVGGVEETWSSRWDNRDSAEAYTNPMRSPPPQTPLSSKQTSTQSSQNAFDHTLAATRSHTSTRFGGLSSRFGGSTRSTKSSGGKPGSSAGMEMEIPTWLTTNGEEKDTSEQGEQGAGDAVSATVSAAAAGGEEDWEVLTDEDGNTYYHHKKTGDTSWEDPRKASGTDIEEDAAGEMATAGESQPPQMYAIRNPSGAAGASNRRKSTLTVVPEGAEAAAAAPMTGVGDERAGRMGGAGGGGNSCRAVSREVSSASSDEAHL